MAFTFKGQEVNNINYNGQPLDRLQFNGVTVWEKTPAAYNWKGLTFTANEDNSTIFIKRSGSNYLFSLSTVEYSVNDGSSWNTWNIIGTSSTGITLSKGERLCVRSTNSHWANANTHWSFFIGEGSIGASGNIMSIIDKSKFETLKTISDDFAFYKLFVDQSRLTSAPELPATTLSPNCYKSMFQNCTSLTTTPSLPATTLAGGCYQYMFDGCTSLIRIAKNELPATTLTPYCYNNMFNGCTSLGGKPDIKGAALVDGCLTSMFNNCKSLSQISVRAGTWNIDNSQGWVSGVASTGTFYNLGEAEIPIGVNGIPSGWTVI